jgi:hypothetical protein
MKSMKMRPYFLPLLAAGIVSLFGCSYHDIGECNPDAQMAIDATILYGIGTNSGVIDSKINNNVPLEDRNVTFAQVLGNTINEEVQCGVPYDWATEEGEILGGSYFSGVETIILTQKNLDVILNVYGWRESQRILDLYSKQATGKYVLDKEKMKNRLRGEDSLVWGFASLRLDINYAYHIFSEIGDIVAHEFTHMTLDREGFSHDHEDYSADLLVNETGWAVRDIMVEEINPAVDLAYEAYLEVKAERNE